MLRFTPQPLQLDHRGLVRRAQNGEKVVQRGQAVFCMCADAVNGVAGRGSLIDSPHYVASAGGGRPFIVSLASHT